MSSSMVCFAGEAFGEDVVGCLGAMISYGYLPTCLFLHSWGADVMMLVFFFFFSFSVAVLVITSSVA